MKKLFPYLLLAALPLIMISWGMIGHQTVATIAGNHLTPKAKAAVKALLGDTSMADVASWADEVLREPAYKHTASWHYANVPLGLNYKAFSDSVSQSKKQNVYSAIQASIHVLTHEDNPIAKRREALKFLIHFVGDLHQPMHISRAEDKGGNTIQLQYAGKGTNLHSLWDSKLIGTEGKSVAEMSVEYDHATPQQIKQWQGDEQLKWLWESYQISTKLYAEAEANNRPDQAYYRSHIHIIHERIEMAGIRLAGLLNRIFENQVIVVAAAPEAQPPVVREISNAGAYPPVELNEVGKHIGERVNVKGLVSGYKEFDNMMLVNMGAPFPDNPLTLVFKGKAVAWGKRLITAKGVKVLVTGTVSTYKGKAQIEITADNQVFVAP